MWKINLRMRNWLWLGLMACLLGVGAGQDLDSYLRLRRQHKVSQPTPVGALELVVGKRVLEVEGVVRGYTVVDDYTSIYLEIDPSKSLPIRIRPSDRWVLNGQVRIRALVQVTRENEWAMPDYHLLAATYASTFARWETQERARQQAQTQKRQPQSAPAPPTRGKDLASRSAPPKQPPTIVDWETFARNLESYVPYYYQAIRKFNPRLNPATAEQIARAILHFSVRYGVDPRFIMAIVLVESGFNPSATSRKGAMGLGQLMPGTARGLGVVDSYDPIQNLEGTVRLVRGHLVKYWSETGDPNDWDHVILALAAYNAGSGAVRRHGGVPPYKETQNYIRKVIRVYKQLCGVKE